MLKYIYTYKSVVREKRVEIREREKRDECESRKQMVREEQMIDEINNRGW